MEHAADQTIDHFGEQWTRFQDNEGYYASTELFLDVCGPLLDADALRGRRVIDIGSGTGRIVQMLLGLGASHVVAVEPSAAMEVLQKNTKKEADRITYVRETGEKIPDDEADYAFAIGVLHHIPEPEPVVRRAYDVLKPGGKCLVWLYGYEGNRPYLLLVSPLRAITKRMPDIVLGAFSHLLCLFISIYIALCRFLPLPLRGYMREVLGKFGWKQRALVIFDQLNPGYAKYYRRDEARRLMESGGFQNVQLRHRHGYSWTVIGEKPTSTSDNS